MLLDKYTKQSPIIGVAGMGGGINSYIFLSSGGGYEISRSLRFNSEDSAYLNRTPSSAGNRKTWTWSGWVKRTKLSQWTVLFGGAVGSNTDGIFITSDNIIYVALGTNHYLAPNLRDTSAWYHIVLSVDTTQSTNTDRIKVYINGVLAAVGTAGYPSQNYDTGVNNAVLQTIGRNAGNTGSFGEYYLADVHLVDGQQLAPTDFGETDDNGVWQPKKFGGSHGTNGFHLDFKDNSSNAALGTDTSGNSNTWTVNNLSVAPTSIDTSQKWSGLLSASGGSGFTNQGAGGFAGFDDTNNYTYVTGASSGTNYTITLTPPSPISFTTSLVVRVESGVSEVTINGGSTWVADTGGLVTFTGPGSFSAITVRDSRGQYSGEFHSVKVDGKLLVDPGALSYVDSLVDTPSNAAEPTDSGIGGEIVGNYAKLNPLDPTTATLSNGNLDCNLGNASTHVRGTFQISSGKWYWEITPTVLTANMLIGICLPTQAFSADLNTSAAFTYYNDGRKFSNGSGSSYGASYTVNDVIGVAFDADAGTLTFYKNGASQGTAFTGLTSEYFPAVSDGTSGAASSFVINFGQRAFAYTAPSGYKALCTANLPEPTIADGSQYFDTKLVSGNSSTQTISGFNFSPDFVWAKSRSHTTDHYLFDIVRGATNELKSNSTSAEGSNSGLTQFNSDGYNIGSDSSMNTSGRTYVNWAWDAGSSTVSNTDGTITSQVRANPSAGFSIVSWTGNSTAGATLGHSLSAAPKMIIIKNRSRGTYGDWVIGHDAINGFQDGNQLYFTTAGVASGEGFFNNTSPTSSVFTVKNNYQVNYAGDNYIAYCFAPVEGYSAMGSYTGNGSTDGPFVHTGFKPKWLLVKLSSAANGNWWIWDSEREPVNPITIPLYANTNAAETSSGTGAHDLISNGFKFRDTGGAYNTNGYTYIYAAFAEHPFKTARAR